MKMRIYKKYLQITLISLALGGAGHAFAETTIVVKKVSGALNKFPISDAVFKNAKAETIELSAQPMANPRPEKTTTAALNVKAVHNGEWIAIHFNWKDKEKSEAGRLGKFSDAVAIQFPVIDNMTPPPIFMGAKDNPVHIFHWRAQYQLDKEKGMRTMKDLYPNMNIDIYPMEFPDMGSLEKVDNSQKEVYSYGLAAGNPQSYTKKGVDEIFAQGFGTSATIENIEAEAEGKFNNGEWNVIITRPLKRTNGSVLEVGKSCYVSFAVWDGGHNEVGSRKSITMSWIPIKIEE